MKLTDATLRLKIGLFLFSKGNEIYDFAAEQVEETRKFAKERFEQGKAFLEKLIDDYENSSFAMSDETLRIAHLEAVSDSNDYEARIDEICFALDWNPIRFGQDLLKLIIENADAIREEIEFYSATSEVAGSTHIPDDFVQGSSVEASNVGWHMEPQSDWKEIWDISDGSGVLIVTIDTGTTPNHPDIPELVAPPASVVPSEPTGIDRNFHGTHCMGTNVGQNGIGVAPGASAWSVQCLSARGSGLTTWTAQAINIAIDKAIELNIPLVISISIGGGGPDAQTTAALARAANLHETHGIPAIVVAAAGNSGYQGRPTTDWPANDINAASVSAYDRNGLIARFSSGGPDVDVGGPGVNIVSADYRGGRSTSSGTSMATPGIAGYAGLQQSLRLKKGYALLRNTAEFIEHCTEVATDAGAPGEDHRFGSGILEILKITEKQKVDDVTQLAVGKKPNGGIATLIAMFLSLVFACGSCNNANAQETEKQLRTVVETIERTTVYYGDTVIREAREKVVAKKEETSRANVFEYPFPVLHLFDSQFKLTKLEPVSPGIFLIPDAGTYLALPSVPEGAKRVTVKEPEPSIDLSTVSPLTKQLADRLNDQPTRIMLVEAYSQATGMIEGKSLIEAGSIVKAHILQVWPRRTGNSLFVDWVNGFQRPLQAEFDRIQLPDTKSYQAALREVVKGLQGQ